MTEELDKRLKEYVKKTLKQGYSKEQIRESLQRVGYDIGVVDKSFKFISRERTTTNILLALLVVVLVVSLFVVWKYYLRPEPLEFLVEQPKEKFAQSNKSILLMSWALPLEAKQNELVNLTTIWKSQKEVTYNYGTELSIVDKNGHALVKYFFNNNRYPTSLRRGGYRYLETYSFDVPYLKPDIYYYKIGLSDLSGKRFFYSYDEAILGNITIMKNDNLIPCGLVINTVRNGSLASNLGVIPAEKIISVNDKPIELGEDLYETVSILRSKFAKEKTLVIKTDRTVYTIQDYTPTFNIYRSLGVIFNFELCEK